MGLVPPVDGFLQRLRKPCDRDSIVPVFRRGDSADFEPPQVGAATYGIRPDLDAPVGRLSCGGLVAYGGSVKLMELDRAGRPLHQAGTLSGNPLRCDRRTSGRWRASPRLFKHLAKLGASSRAASPDAARAPRSVALQVNAFGSLLTPFFTDRPVPRLRIRRRCRQRGYGRFFRAMLAEDLPLPPSELRRGSCPGPHTPRHVDQTIKAARAAIKRFNGSRAAYQTHAQDGPGRNNHVLSFVRQSVPPPGR
jgi:glutamate-1-semialdehyde 2,1-aminomutase